MKELMELRQLAQQIDNQEAISLYNRVDKEIERLNKIIGHTLGYIECANKVDITYVCKILKGEDKE